MSVAYLWAARRERAVVFAGLAAVVAAGLWGTLYTGDWLMMPSAPPEGTIAYVVLLFAMWWTMMMAMMLPTAAPAILSYGAIARNIEKAGPMSAFVAGYAAVWSAFSAAAVALQIVTADLIPLTGMMAVISKTVGGGLLVAAGLYQFTPLKHACLKHCQSPFFYIAHHWQNGAGGAWRMGLSHGAFCTGCCWVLMLLLFYGGVMELTWIVGLALYVGAEKLIPAKFHVDKITGAALTAWGLWVIWHSVS
jgi:predicted metal-binding membrane protein